MALRPLGAQQKEKKSERTLSEDEKIARTGDAMQRSESGAKSGRPTMYSK